MFRQPDEIEIPREPSRPSVAVTWTSWLFPTLAALCTVSVYVWGAGKLDQRVTNMEAAQARLTAEIESHTAMIAEEQKNQAVLLEKANSMQKTLDRIEGYLLHDVPLSK